jgi:hypothetical protein
MTTLKSHHSKPPKKPTATKPKPIPPWMQNTDATPIDGWSPPAKTGAASRVDRTPPDKGKSPPKHTPAKPSAKAAAVRRKPRGSR